MSALQPQVSTRRHSSSGVSPWCCWVPPWNWALFAAATLGVFAFTGLLIFAQLVWSGWQARNLNPASTLHKPQFAATPPRQRIIWLLLDELSYQQLYERRFSGLELPAFDQLAAQATVFTHVIPAGEYTRYIVPTLFTGVPSTAVNISARGLLLSLKDPSTGKWTPFHQREVCA